MPFKFDLISPERILISEDVEQVVVPGAEGDFAVLPGHAPLVSTLRPGVLEVTGDSGRQRLLVKGGFAEVEQNHLTVLVERTYDIAQMERGEIARELEAAVAALDAARDDAARLRAYTLVEQLKALQSQAAH